MTFGSLFSGIGGLDLGLERAGMVCKWQVEIDEFCLEVLKKHWPNVRKFGDIRKLTSEELESVDLICGGFPCQPVSRAGTKKYQDDERWYWPEFARIVRAVRPKFLLVENVTGLLDGPMSDVLGDMAEMGFDADWCSLSACSFGAPHTRERVFIVAYTCGILGIEGMAEEIRTLPEGDHREMRQRWVATLPGVRRGIDGISKRLDSLGNAVVPIVAQWVGRQILKAVEVTC